MYNNMCVLSAFLFVGVMMVGILVSGVMMSDGGDVVDQ
jgi:hypothetical protein